jgi:hypothetical protein
MKKKVIITGSTGMIGYSNEILENKDMRLLR